MEMGLTNYATDIARKNPSSAPWRGSPIRWSWIAWAVALTWLLYLVAVPVGYMLFDAVTNEAGQLTLANFRVFFENPRLQAATVNSVLVGCGVAIFSVVIGGPLAFGVARTRMRFKGLVQAAVVISLVSPDFLLAIAYVGLAGPNAGYLNTPLQMLFRTEVGPLNIFSLWGLIFMALPHGVAFVFLTMVPALRNLDPSLDEAARVQGAGTASVAFRITLPLISPALLSGALLAFTTSLATYGPAHVLGVNVLTISIREAMLRLDFKAASVASIALVAMSLIALAIYRHSIRREERFRVMGGKPFSYRPIPDGPATSAMTVLGVVYALFALIVPYGTLFAISLMHSVGQGFKAGNWTLANYAAMIDNPMIHHAAQLSLSLAAVSATLVTAVGFLIAFLLVRSRAAGRSVLDYLSMLPLALPGSAVALALVVVYLSPPLNILGLYGTFGILLVAYLARFITFGVRMNQSSLLQLAPELEEAARTSGAGPLRSVLLITAPLMRNALIYTWILVFILAVPELSASIILKGLNTPTLSTVLLDIWIGNGGPAVASALGMTIFAGVGLLLLIATSIGRRVGVSVAR